jgi:hypothetical protein
MQPAAEPRFDCAEHISQRSLGVAMNPGLGGSVFPKVYGRQGYSFQGRRPKYIRGKLPVGKLGYGIAVVRTKVVRRRTDVAAVAGYAASCGTSRSAARVRGSSAPIRAVVCDL